MKTFLLALAFLIVSQQACAEDENRYEYFPLQKMMVDTTTGKTYRYVVSDREVKHVVIDYVSGTIKENGLLKPLKSLDAKWDHDVIALAQK